MYSLSILIIVRYFRQNYISCLVFIDKIAKIICFRWPWQQVIVSHIKMLHANLNQTFYTKFSQIHERHA